MSEESTIQNDSEQPSQGTPTQSQRVLAGVLGILLGAFGVHKFVLGYTKEGIIMLILGLLTCWNFPVMVLIGLIEGIVYLTKSDEEFIAVYQKGRKGWF